MSVLNKLLLAIVAAGCFVPLSNAQEATYRLTVFNDWNPVDFPANYPGNAHFSTLGGGTHDGAFSYWEFGGTASSQIELMAEAGNTQQLFNRIQGDGGTGLQWNYWFCEASSTNPACGNLVVEFTVDADQSFVTLTQMIAPSPDWFVGVSALNLRPNGVWIDDVTIDLDMYDAGTEDGLIPNGSNPATNPQSTIQYIVYDAGNGIYPVSAQSQSVGTYRFELIAGGDIDTDGDGVNDDLDNCTEIANADQADANGDGFGNRCDGDTNDDCLVNFLDVGAFANVFQSADAVHDFNGDGIVNFLDYPTIIDGFMRPPGPSALADCAN